MAHSSPTATTPHVFYVLLWQIPCVNIYFIYYRYSLCPKKINITCLFWEASAEIKGSQHPLTFIVVSYSF